MLYDPRQKKLAAEAAHRLGSQAELARTMKVTRQQVNDWIKGRCGLTGDQVLKIQDLLRRFDSKPVPRRPEYTFYPIQPLAALSAILQKAKQRIMELVNPQPCFA